MNDCAHRPRLDAYEDDQLDEGRRAEVEEHLRACPRCAAEMREIRSLRRYLAENGRHVSDEEVRALAAGVGFDAEPVLLVFFRRTAVAATVVLACGVAAGLYFGGRGYASAPPPTSDDLAPARVPAEFRADPAGADPWQRRRELARWISNDLAGDGQESR